MKRIQFDDDHFTLSFAGETRELLPKEYALFVYFSHHPNRTFTREELLDAVWPLETPVDRTVDDHIYRLRKKLKDWSHVLIIETIRGRGYRLKIIEENRIENPLLANEQLRTEFTNLFSIYMRYGQGQALETLSQHHDILGFKLDCLRTYYLQFMTGDFKRLVEDDPDHFWDKAFYLLHLYTLMQSERGFDFVKRAISLQKLPSLHQKELESYNLVTFYLDQNQLKSAQQKLEEVQSWVLKDQVDALIPIMHILELQILLHQRQVKEAEEKIRQCEALFLQYPYLREKGSFYLLKGVWSLLSEDQEGGVRTIQEGLDILKQSKFVPHLLFGMKKLIQYLHEFQLDSRITSPYKAYWNDLINKYQLQELAPKINRLLEHHL